MSVITYSTVAGTENVLTVGFDILFLATVPPLPLLLLVLAVVTVIFINPCHELVSPGAE